MPGANSFPEGTQALATDSEKRSLIKIVQLLNDAGSGVPGVTNSNYHIVGSGTPATDVPPTGYNVAYNDDGNFWIKTTSGWAQRF